ncbi:MAG: histidine kinase, partial [Treponema sp.]|nr:histidine kinase [Treponema sp.]
MNMKKIKTFIEKYMFSESLSLDARIINMICMVGMLAALATAVVRIFMRSGGVMIIVMSGIIFSIAFLMFVCNRFRWYVLGTWITLFMLCGILFPAAYFFLGGMDSGMAAFFVLSVVIIFLLLDGKALVIFLSSHVVVVIACYVTEYHFPQVIKAVSRSYQMVDNILAFLVSGFFIGVVILFQERLYLREKEKADAAGQRLARQDKLLRVINTSATLLLSSDTEEFESLMSRSMEMLARNLEVDRINLWKNSVKGGTLYYHRLYSWSADTG